MHRMKTFGFGEHLPGQTPRVLSFSRENPLQQIRKNGLS